MSMSLKKGHKALIDEARAKITTLDLEEVKPLLQDDSVLFVDIRDRRELEREGKIPGAFHAPRGMLEFWVDPESPYYKPVFGEGKKLVLYCQSAWRSSLAAATLVEMGFEDVVHIEGGFRAWKDTEQPIEAVEKK